MKEIYYIGKYDFFRDNSKHIPAKLTGRWKIVRTEHGDQILYLEHKGLFFKKWVIESDFWCGYDREEYINECAK